MSLYEFSINVIQWSLQWQRRGNQIEKEAEEGAVELGCFSRTDGNIIPHSRNNLLVFQQPSPGANLDGNDYGDYLNQQYSSEGWDYLDPHLRCNIDVQQYDVVAGRSTLVKLGSALYEGKYSFELDAITFGANRTLYMSSYHAKKRKQTGKHHYWAARFEALCTKRETVNTEPCFYSILKRKIGRHQVLFYAEIDCKLEKKSKPSKPQANYVELKCRRHVPDDNHHRFMNQYLKYWLQSHLASVPTIVEGVRDDHGKLLHVNRFETEKLPKICRRHWEVLGKGWNTEKVLDFLEFALDQIMRLCELNAGVTVRVKFDAKQKRLTAHLLHENEFVLKVQSTLARSKPRRKQRKNKLRKSENAPVNVERDGTRTDPSTTPRDHETDQLMEVVHSDPEPCKNPHKIAISTGIFRLTNRILVCLPFVLLFYVCRSNIFSG